MATTRLPVPTPERVHHVLNAIYALIRTRSVTLGGSVWLTRADIQRVAQCRTDTVSATLAYALETNLLTRRRQGRHWAYAITKDRKAAGPLVGFTDGATSGSASGAGLGATSGATSGSGLTQDTKPEPVRVDAVSTAGSGAGLGSALGAQSGATSGATSGSGFGQHADTAALARERHAPAPTRLHVGGQEADLSCANTRAVYISSEVIPSSPQPRSESATASVTSTGPLEDPERHPTVALETALASHPPVTSSVARQTEHTQASAREQARKDFAATLAAHPGGTLYGRFVAYLERQPVDQQMLALSLLANLTLGVAVTRHNSAALEKMVRETLTDGQPRGMLSVAQHLIRLSAEASVTAPLRLLQETLRRSDQRDFTKDARYQAGSTDALSAAAWERARAATAVAEDWIDNSKLVKRSVVW